MLKISACTIVRDEEKNILRWLENVETFADEIIVVDTGSKDSTKEIAKSRGAILYDFPWIDDFSAAKNFAIDKATGDWIVMLDADEFFDAESQHNLRSILKKYHKDKKVAGLITPFINIDVNHNNRILSRAYQMRVFRREPHLRFMGKVHESLMNFAPKGNDRDYLMMEKLQFIHTGYSIDNLEAKQRRNLAIIEAEIKEQGGVSPRQFGYLADCYMVVKDYEKVIYYARMAIEHGEESGLLGQEKKVVSQLLEAIRLSGKGDYEYELNKAMQDFPQVAELYFFRGRLLFERLQWLEAERDFCQAAYLIGKPLENIGEIYNSGIGHLKALLQGYLEQITRYKNYFIAMDQGDYTQAGNLVIKYWQNLNKRPFSTAQQEEMVV